MLIKNVLSVPHWGEGVPSRIRRPENSEERVSDPDSLMETSISYMLFGATLRAEVAPIGGEFVGLTHPISAKWLVKVEEI